jgi:hypothetical protein
MSKRTTERPITNVSVVYDDPALGRVLFVLPQVAQDAPPNVKEGVRRRWVAAIGGECPCGGQRALGPGAMSVEHEVDCPACDTVLGPTLRRWVEER